jgi:hypothetical protein
MGRAFLFRAKIWGILWAIKVFMCMASLRVAYFRYGLSYSAVRPNVPLARTTKTDAQIKQKILM